MKTFAYVAKDPSGKTLKGNLQAETAQDLLNTIHEKGLFCVSYSEFGLKQGKVAYKFKTKDLSFDCRQLSAMVSSGLTLVKALDILYREQTNKNARKIWREIFEDVQKGNSFSDALKVHEGAFPNFLISMVSAGESSGQLDVILNRMSEHYAKESKLQNKIKGALTYPAILLVLSVAVVIALFTFIMPTFMGMFAGTDLPALTKIMMKISDFMREQGYILAIVVAFIVGAFVYAMKIPKFRLKMHKMFLTVPVAGKLIVKVYTGRFARNLSSLYSSGIPMVECVEKASAILGNEYIDEQFKTVVDDIKKGEPLSTSINKAEIFDSMFCSIIYVGEESGALDDILSKTSDFYEDEADTAISKLVGLIEPVMIIFLGLVIGLIIASVMPAMYAMYDNVG